MIPKDKAIELVCRYSCLHLGEDFKKWGTNIVFNFMDIECALIFVQQIIAYENQLMQTEVQYNYWKEVKQEIEKL